MSVGAVPDQWKTAVVMPVFKSGIATSGSNYKPISSTCVACKIMERIIVDQMTDHLMQNGVLKKPNMDSLKGFLPARCYCCIQGVPKKRIHNFIFGITLVIQHRF